MEECFVLPVYVFLIEKLILRKKKRIPRGTPIKRLGEIEAFAYTGLHFSFLVSN